MNQIKIEGRHVLHGTIHISGAKNSAVALVPASLLADEMVSIDNVPNISDIDALDEILTYLGANVSRDGNLMKIDPSNIVCREIPESISAKLRASYYFMSAMLGKFHHVEMYFPGGCAIGARPIDQTLKAFKALGATVIEEGNKYIVDADRLIGAPIYLDMPSVGATINAILVAAKAEGVTTIENCAKEPEIVSIATFLNNMGAKIRGAGTSTITITGVAALHGCFTEVIPDRIEAGTYMIAGALLGNQLKIANIIPEHVESLTLKLKEMGYPIEIGDDYIIISSIEHPKAISVKTLGYPGFPTDLQQPLTVLLTQSTGTSKLEETIYENRFGHVPYLNRMGSDILIKDRSMFVTGETKLVGKEVVATDLRAGAAMILAGLAAHGTTTINSIEHVLRGYENILEKLTSVGAKVDLIEI